MQGIASRERAHINVRRASPGEVADALGVVFRGGEHLVRRHLQISNRGRGAVDLLSHAQEQHTALARHQKRQRGRPSCGPGHPGCGEQAGSTLNGHSPAPKLWHVFGTEGRQ